MAQYSSQSFASPFLTCVVKEVSLQRMASIFSIMPLDPERSSPTVIDPLALIHLGLWSVPVLLVSFLRLGVFLLSFALWRFGVLVLIILPTQYCCYLSDILNNFLFCLEKPKYFCIYTYTWIPFKIAMYEYCLLLLT